MSTIGVAGQSAGSMLLSALMNEVRQLGKPWEQTPEREQEVVIDRLRRAVEVSVRNVVQTIAASSFPRIPATVESVTFKDGVKAVLTLSKGEDGTHALADATGGQAMVVLATHSQFLEGLESVKADADQSDMFGADSCNSTAASGNEEAVRDADSLLVKLRSLAVFPVESAVALWTEQERTVAWEWALAYEQDADRCTIARPHWLPIPDGAFSGQPDAQGEQAA